MKELTELLENILNERLEQIVLSDARTRELAFKVKVRPVMIKQELLFQETLYRGTQVFHHNYSKEEIAGRLSGMLGQQAKQCGAAGQPQQTQQCGAAGQPQQAQQSEVAGLPSFGQAQFSALDQSATVLVSKKGKLTVKVKRKAAGKSGSARQQGMGMQTDDAVGQCGNATGQSGITQLPARTLAHNRTRQYILQEGVPVDFLVGLGVQSPDGKVTKAKFDKFRQINRYLEFIEDVLEELPTDRTIRIIDFGCGKSYLTFAMYYYLHELQGRDIQVTGLDLKADVIDHCNQLAEKCGYDRLHFEKGDISTYTGADQVDMVVTLHACDVATDYALEKAVKWGARVIMAVPCCQHEVNRQIHCEPLKPVLKYGLIKERMSALITDAVRANLLTGQGYDTQILEFIDMEHTPKNLLIRAVKKQSATAAQHQTMQPTGSAECQSRQSATAASMRPRQSARSAKKEDINELLEYLGINPTLAKLLREQEEAE